MNLDQQKYLETEKPERFERLIFHIPPLAKFNIERIAIEAYHAARYTGIINADADPNLDPSDTPLGRMIFLGALENVAPLSSDPEKFQESFNYLFDEINRLTTNQIEQARQQYNQDDENATVQEPDSIVDPQDLEDVKDWQIEDETDDS